MLTITMPFPASDLMPNRKNGKHWGSTQAVKRKAWDDAYMLSLQALNGHRGDWYPLDGDVPLTLTFHEPDRRCRDLDNLLAACKAQIDALATVLTVNDKRFQPITIRRGETVKGGSVVVEVGA